MQIGIGISLTCSYGTKYSGPLDGLSVAPALAYSFRRLLSTYTGPLIRLRRSSDNAEQDIGYVGNGDLDTAAASSFIGAGSGYIAKVYDQSGNSYDWTQVTFARQPLYSASLVNSKPAFSSDGVDDYLTATVTGLSFTAFQSSLVVRIIDQANSRGIVNFNAGGSTQDWAHEDALNHKSDSANLSIIERYVGTNVLVVQSTGHSASPRLIGFRMSGGNASLRVDKSEVHTDTYDDLNSIDPTNFMCCARYIGGPQQYHKLYIPEYVGFTSLLSSADQSALENNQQSYWGTP